MPTDVVMPQMGESIAEGTIVRWIKKVGDAVERDEPLFEISTDKVDAEIPSPAAGVLSEIRAKEGQTVPVNSVVAVIGAAASEAPAADAARAEATPPAPQPQADGAPSASAAPPQTGAAAPQSGRATGAPAGASASSPEGSHGSAQAGPVPGRPHRPADLTKAPSDRDAERQRSSPLVRRLAKEHNLDISTIHGSGMGGRVTRDDVLAAVGSRQAPSSPPPASAPPAAPPSAAQPASAKPQPAGGPVARPD